MSLHYRTAFLRDRYLHKQEQGPKSRPLGSGKSIVLPCLVEVAVDRATRWTRLFNVHDVTQIVHDMRLLMMRWIPIKFICKAGSLTEVKEVKIA